MNQYSELKNNIVIDPLDLDSELIQQPELYRRVSDAHDEAVSIRDFKKEELAVVDAELLLEYKRQDSKATVGAIEASVLTDHRHEEAFLAYNQAKLVADKLGTLVESFRQRSSMLKALAEKMTSQSYQVDSVKEQYTQSRQALAEKRRAVLVE